MQRAEEVLRAQHVLRKQEAEDAFGVAQRQPRNGELPPGAVAAGGAPPEGLQVEVVLEVYPARVRGAAERAQHGGELVGPEPVRANLVGGGAQKLRGEFRLLVTGEEDAGPFQSGLGPGSAEMFQQVDQRENRRLRK